MTSFDMGVTDKGFFAVTYKDKVIFCLDKNGKAYSQDRNIWIALNQGYTYPLIGPNYETKTFGTWSIGHTSTGFLIFICDNKIIATLTASSVFFIGGLITPTIGSRLWDPCPELGPDHIKFGHWTFGADKLNEGFLFQYENIPAMYIPIDKKYPLLSRNRVSYNEMDPYYYTNEEKVASWLGTGDAVPKVPDFGKILASVHDKVDSSTKGPHTHSLTGEMKETKELEGIVGQGGKTIKIAASDASKGMKHFFTDTIGHHIKNPSHW